MGEEDFGVYVIVLDRNRQNDEAILRETYEWHFVEDEVSETQALDLANEIHQEALRIRGF